MEIQADEIELFDDLTQFHLDYRRFDLHNDFVCLRVSFELPNLILDFQREIDGTRIQLEFCEASVVKLNYDPRRLAERSTIDTLYRGRYLLNGSLSEFSPRQEGYFYLSFWEGLETEFFSRSLSWVIETPSSPLDAATTS